MKQLRRTVAFTALFFAGAGFCAPSHAGPLHGRYLVGAADFEYDPGYSNFKWDSADDKVFKYDKDVMKGDQKVGQIKFDADTFSMKAKVGDVTLTSVGEGLAGGFFRTAPNSRWPTATPWGGSRS